MNRSGALARVMESVKKYVVGLDDLLKLLAVALLTEGHILVEGPSGSGKTTALKLFSSFIGGKFSRVQMTPDLLPSDLIGSYYFDLKRGEWVLREGPVFADLLLVDELNRAPPRTQAALLESMQERQVSIEGRTFRLSPLFLVLASQMNGAAEGTYPLTPPLRDRFAYSINLGLPSRSAEIEILRKVDEIDDVVSTPVARVDEVLEEKKRVRKVYTSDRILEYIVDLVNFVRSSEEVLVPPSPRASIWLFRGARALAYLDGMDYVLPDHVKYISRYALRHRIILKPQYEAEGVRPEDIVDKTLRSVEVPRA